MGGQLNIGLMLRLIFFSPVLNMFTCYLLTLLLTVLRLDTWYNRTTNSNLQLMEPHCWKCIFFPLIFDDDMSFRVFENFFPHCCRVDNRKLEKRTAIFLTCD